MSAGTSCLLTITFKPMVSLTIGTYLVRTLVLLCELTLCFTTYKSLYIRVNMQLKFLLSIDQGSVGSWCSRAKFQVLESSWAEVLVLVTFL